jgi:hypothetical protein
MSVEEKRKPGRTFSEPRIFLCEQCGSTLRAYHSGAHICPACRVEIDVSFDGTLTFFEKL